ncbi:hypothetical protein NN3_23240 [Nocardia neocaledoniensis NBRC 108232]|uniref:Bulb-type lectin domain-containing protein n=1 Tax=Nocardia neocaledoniensis TaxID=236511 RepID=A0A317N1Z0_9NOCA|nr:hypothetical protein [Nocardia neocaledoniensis]PWV66946.1 hypothetical protein DFR69_12211 [Nocardia neocaledoniensis]GEM31317.1 hypothetical protein NN3_23240 [Nocardia neocaledoniensis NBRC 108232]
MAPTTTTQPDAAPKVDAGTQTNGLAAGASLGIGQKLESQNGQYSLRIDNGNLVLTGPGGTAWQSGTNNDKGAIVHAAFGKDGSLDLKANAYYQALSVWSTEQKLPGAARLQLNNDGSLVVLDEKNAVLGSIAKAPVRAPLSIQLHRPLGASAMLRAVIDMVEERLRVAASPEVLGTGATTKVVNLDQLLTNEGLADTKNVSTMVTSYNGKLDRLQRVKDTLHAMTTAVDASTAEVSERRKQTLDKIEKIVSDLNDKLWEPNRVSTATTGGDGKYADISYDERGELRSAKLRPHTEEALLRTLFDAVGAVETEIKAMVAAADNSGQKIGQNVPHYENERPRTDSGVAPAIETTDYSPLFTDLLGETAADDDRDTDPAAPRGGDSGVLTLLNSAIRDLKAGGTAKAAGTSAPGGGQSAGGGSNPLAAMSQMLPLLMSSMMMNNSANSRDKKRKQSDEPDETRPEPAPAPEPQAQASAVPAPGGGPEAALPPPSAVTATPARPATMVDLKLAGLRSQEVSSVVAEAVQKELNNPNGSDAKTAYQGTAGQADTWTQADGSQLRTGDIVEWRNGTGLLVVSENGVQVIVDGQLTPLEQDGQPKDGRGRFGEFMAFRHPGGADSAPAPVIDPSGAPPPIPAPVPAGTTAARPVPGSRTT